MELKFGEFFREHRKKQNLTQEQVGKKLNVSKHSVSKWENGKSEPHYDLYIKIADLFHITIGDILEHTSRKDIKLLIADIYRSEKRENQNPIYAPTGPEVYVNVTNIAEELKQRYGSLGWQGTSQSFSSGDHKFPWATQSKNAKT